MQLVLKGIKLPSRTNYHPGIVLNKTRKSRSFGRKWLSPRGRFEVLGYSEYLRRRMKGFHAGGSSRGNQVSVLSGG